MFTRLAMVFLIAAVVSGCRLKDNDAGPAAIPPPADVAAPPSDAVTTPSGLATKIISPGMSNVKPELRSVVRVHYTGWTTDGTMFDTSFGGRPAEFAVTGVIPGWTEALQLMVVGEKRRVWVPAQLAYEGMPGRPQGMLVFDIELLGVQ
jgi:peptidylprolyl isomerase